jgi:flagellar protein FliO/FliZ
MDVTTYLQFLASLVFVLALIGLAAFIARRAGLGTRTRGGSRRLGVVEVLPLDGRRKLVLVRCDEREHLIILGSSGETVVGPGLRARRSFADQIRQADARGDAARPAPVIGAEVPR